MKGLPSSRSLFFLLLLMAAFASGCAKSSSTTIGAPSGGAATQMVFDAVVPSVVAVLNDDRAIREDEQKRAMEELGKDEHAPKNIIDVSLRKEPMPHGTGFLIEGGFVITAAHVVLSPDHIKLTTRGGETVDAELVQIDEVRDVAVLRPKTPLKNVPALKLAAQNPSPGRPVWALGHTGAGLWALSWGISEGITSGIVELLGAKLLLFDAAVYPGFSGGPVITVDDAGHPVVVGVNHAILFTGGEARVASISSASSVADIRDVLAHVAAPIETKLAAFAKQKSLETRATLFITKNFSVHRDPQMLTTAAIVGNDRTIVMGTDDTVRIPVLAMLFGLTKGKHDVSFELLDPSDVLVDRVEKPIKVEEHERVSFASADFRFGAKSSGHYDVVAKVAGKVVGKTVVWVQDDEDDDQQIDEEHTDADDNGEPQVDVIVASFGRDDPFALGGIRAGWVEWRFPRRVDFTWFARGSRGWSGTNVAISAFVLDDAGKIVGQGVGCIRPELRPEHTWSCAGAGGTPLVSKEGKYDVVFALNDRPIAVWPMEAMVRTSSNSSALDKWMKDLHQKHDVKKHAPKKPLPVVPPPAPPAAKPGAATKPPATKPAAPPADLKRGL
jgi:S1-C subfamily serine protease